MNNCCLSHHTLFIWYQFPFQKGLQLLEFIPRAIFLQQRCSIITSIIIWNKHNLLWILLSIFGKLHRLLIVLIVNFCVSLPFKYSFCELNRFDRCVITFQIQNIQRGSKFLFVFWLFNIYVTVISPLYILKWKFLYITIIFTLYKLSLWFT